MVVIGYNGGARFKRCIASVQPQTDHIVYVDSGSTDDSVAWSQEQGVDVVVWEPEHFSAGGARNRGFERLREQVPDLTYVQFLDTDMIVDGAWLATGRKALDEDPRTAIVCGRTREEQAHRSLYNRLSEMDWAKPLGPIEHCEGGCMARASMFAAVGGYATEFHGGVEEDLCHRLHQRGWSILHLNAPMIDHDAAQTAFAQWWQRRVRQGATFAHSAQISQAPAIHRVVRRARLWTAGPLLIALGGLLLLAMGSNWTAGSVLLGGVALLWGLRLVWLAARELRQGWTWTQALVYALAALVADWAYLTGLIRYQWRKQIGKI
ncbi:MAG: glycosyltransferase [Candidatus Latescibacteria bacterium]|nr:glycosyltransferase [Candidatus Latescibacterota bacterium]